MALRAVPHVAAYEQLCRPSSRQLLRPFALEIDAELRRFREVHPPLVEGVSWQVRELLRCLHEHLFEPSLNVRELKTRCRMRDHNVSCRFGHEMGVSIKAYIEALRLEAADQILRAGIASVSDVAQSVGYCYLQTFYRAYARRFHRTPGRVCDEGSGAAGRGAEAVPAAPSAETQRIALPERRSLTSIAGRI
jgi:AraC-like DNA-binding protein